MHDGRGRQQHEARKGNCGHKYGLVAGERDQGQAAAFIFQDNILAEMVNTWEELCKIQERDSILMKDQSKAMN